MVGTKSSRARWLAKGLWAGMLAGTLASCGSSEQGNGTGDSDGSGVDQHAMSSATAERGENGDGSNSESVFGETRVGRGNRAPSRRPENPEPVEPPMEVDQEVDWEAFDIVYSPMFSAYDGVHVYQVPAYVNGIATEPEDWEAVPADAVSFSPWQSDDGSEVGVLITIERPEPEVVIGASSGLLGGLARLYITEATPDQWEVGKERYINGETFDIEAFRNDPELRARAPEILEMLEFDEDGNPTFTGTAADLGISTDMRCDSCHTTGADNFQVQHTPTQAARFSDEELINIFTEGMKPPGVGYRALPERFQSFYEVMHTWNVSEEQVLGLVVYLRSLTPEGQGDILLPNGLYAAANLDFSKLPPSCNPGNEAFEVATCIAELPPICQPLGLEFDRDACMDHLGISPPEDQQAPNEESTEEDSTEEDSTGEQAAEEADDDA